MKTAVFLELKKGELRDVSLEVLQFALELKEKEGGEIYGILLGEAGNGTVEKLSRAPLQKIFHVKGGDFSRYHPDYYKEAVVEVIKKEGIERIIIPATSIGKDMGPRIASALGVGMISECVGYEYGDSILFKRSLFAGKAYGFFKLNTTPQVITVRPKQFPSAELTGGSAEWVEIDYSPSSSHYSLQELEEREAEEIDVQEADIIVSGGRGVKGPDGFNVIRSLVNTINELRLGKAAVGASRVAVDSGWIDHSHQVGQTGKVVSPKLYIAAGISGALQHLAGMKTSKVIVAVNKDPEAPIFKVADYGIIEDLFKVIPEIEKILKEEYGGK